MQIARACLVLSAANSQPTRPEIIPGVRKQTDVSKLFRTSETLPPFQRIIRRYDEKEFLRHSRPFNLSPHFTERPQCQRAASTVVPESGDVRRAPHARG